MTALKKESSVIIFLSSSNISEFSTVELVGFKLCLFNNLLAIGPPIKQPAIKP